MLIYATPLCYEVIAKIHAAAPERKLDVVRRSVSEEETGQDVKLKILTSQKRGGSRGVLSVRIYSTSYTIADVFQVP